MSTRLTIADLWQAKQDGRRLAAVSCYDFTTASLAAQADVDLLLVGDSAAEVMLGHDSTLPVTMDFMVAITAAVRRAAPQAYLVADMPFLSYQTGHADAIRNAGRFVVEAGAQMVKFEATRSFVDTVRAVSDSGISVMAHVGIRPQYIGKVGRFRAEGTTAEMGYELLSLAEDLVSAGAQALLIEGTAAEVAERVTRRVSVPVIGCGAGAGCDGQILIAADILGLTQGHKPKFARSFVDLGEQAVAGFAGYAEAVRGGTYPTHDTSYHMKEGQVERLDGLLSQAH